MNYQAPLVSIIIPTYNRAIRIIQTLDSIFAQTYNNLEVIIVDDGSSDNTLQVLNGYNEKNNQDRVKFKVMTQKNAGAPAARNNGLKNSNGEYVVFFDSDDIMLPEKIEIQTGIMMAENSDCCACGFLVNGKQEEYQPTIIEGKEVLYSFLKNKLLGSTQSWMFKKSLIVQAGGYDESLKCRQDVDITFRILTLQPKISITKQILSVFMESDDENRIMNSVLFNRSGYNSIVIYHSKVIDYCVSKKKFTLLFVAMQRYCGDIRLTYSSISYTDVLKDFTNIVKRNCKYGIIYQLYLFFLTFAYMNYYYFRK